MARRYHAATWRPLGPQTQPPMRSHDLICVHTMVGSLTGTDAYFRDGGYGGTESHFGTGGNGERPLQWQDLAFTADAANTTPSKYTVIASTDGKAPVSAEADVATASVTGLTLTFAP